MMLAGNKASERLIAIAILIALAVGAYAVIVRPVIERLQKARDDIIEQRMLLGRLHGELDRSSNEPQIPVDGKRAIFLPGVSTAIRVANLQARLGALTTETGVAILSARAIPQEKREGLLFDGVEIAFRAADNQLRQLLNAIERDRPFLFIDGLQMTPASAEAGVDNNGSIPNNVTLRILGVAEVKAE